MNLLKDMEALDLIEVVKETAGKKKSKSRSERLAGSISSDQADAMRKELLEMRSEWDRNI